MTITAALIKELRNRTGIAMMECKKALELTHWDIDKAIEELRKKWLAKAAKKSDREALEWGIKIISEWSKSFIISVSCETDFLAKSDRFKSMLDEVVNFLRNNGSDSKSSAQSMIETNYSLEMWENLQIKDYEIIEWWTTANYVHSNSKLAAVVVAQNWADEEKLKQVAMHITASNPEYLSPEEISSEVVEKEKSIQLEMMKNDPKMQGKPDEVLLKIIEGKMWKFKSEISLLEQAFVISPDIRVKDFLGTTQLAWFKRYSI